MTQSNFANFCNYMIICLHIKVTLYEKGSCKCVPSQGAASLSAARHHGQVQTPGLLRMSLQAPLGPSSAPKPCSELREDGGARLRSLRARPRPLALRQAVACPPGRSSRPCPQGFVTTRPDWASRGALCTSLGMAARQELSLPSVGPRNASPSGHQSQAIKGGGHRHQGTSCV